MQIVFTGIRIGHVDLAVRKRTVADRSGILDGKTAGIDLGILMISGGYFRAADREIGNRSAVEAEECARGIADRIAATVEMTVEGYG